MAILLSLVVYIDYVQAVIPVWPNTEKAALIVWLFIISIIGKT